VDRQVTYSEIRISFEKSQIAIDNSDKDSLGYKLQLALKSGIDLLKSLVTGILATLAFLLPLLPIAVIVYLIIRYISRRFSKKGDKELKQ
jgi:hypothetical protein